MSPAGSVAEAAGARGVAVAAGAEFDVAGEDVPALRVSVTRVDKRQIDQGIRLLAEAVREVQSRAGIDAVDAGGVGVRERSRG